MLDANIILDCLVLEISGQPRPGKAASEHVLNLCDNGAHHGLMAWHSLPIIAYYHERQNTTAQTAAMMDALISMLEVPVVGHHDAVTWRMHGITDFEDSLQIASAMAGAADVLITRNTKDFVGCVLPVMTPEAFLAAYS